MHAVKRFLAFSVIGGGIQAIQLPHLQFVIFHSPFVFSRTTVAPLPQRDPQLKPYLTIAWRCCWSNIISDIENRPRAKAFRTASLLDIRLPIAWSGSLSRTIDSCVFQSTNFIFPDSTVGGKS